jgi:serine-type D-Ala-D-Ala carboxypeptidase
VKVDRHIAGLVQKAIADRVFPGCVAGIIDGEGQDIAAFGAATYDAGAARIDATSMYDVASLTKTIVTATLVHQLVEAGQCRLDEPVAAHIPEFAANGKAAVLIAHLMSYTVQLRSSYFDDWNGDTSLWTFPELLQVYYGASLKTAPGEHYLYTDATAMLLGELIRRVAGRDLEVLAEERIFAPLGMGDSTLDPKSRDARRIVPTGYRPDGRLIWAVPNDEKAEVAYAAGVQSGLAGLFSTAGDVLAWVAMIFAGGRSGAHRVLSENAVRLMTHDYYPDKPFRSALGWGDGKTYDGLAGAGGPQILAKGGFAGCFMIGDIARKRAVVLLANRVHPQRPTDLGPWLAFRRDVVRHVFED